MESGGGRAVAAVRRRQGATKCMYGTSTTGTSSTVVLVRTVVIVLVLCWYWTTGTTSTSTSSTRPLVPYSSSTRPSTVLVLYWCSEVGGIPGDHPGMSTTAVLVLVLVLVLLLQ
jgi:hypothetical protein